MGCGPSREAATCVATDDIGYGMAKAYYLEQQNNHTRDITTHTHSDDTSYCGNVDCPKRSAESGIVKDENSYGVKDLERRGVRYEGLNGKRIEDVYEGVHDNSRNICRSVAGYVRRVTHKQTGIDYAVKIFSLHRLSEKGMRQLQEEVRILSEVDHPNIICLEEVYRSESAIYLVQELCEGGDLFNWIGNSEGFRRNSLTSEERCVDIVRQLLSALRYLHSKGIVHRDLKLENVLFETKDANSKVKLIDFGLSTHFKPGETHDEYVGSLYTMAPEVIRRNYDERCDVWSLGVIAFILLCGEAPFGGCYGEKDQQPVITRIARGFYQFEPKEEWKNISSEAKQFVCTILRVDRRPTVEEAQGLPWVLNRTDEETRHDASTSRASEVLPEWDARAPA